MSEFLLSIEQPIGVISAVLIFAGQLTYFMGIWNRKIQPSLLSWFGWASLMTTLVVAQIVSIGWEWSLTGVVTCTLGCWTIAAIALIKRNYQIFKLDWWFLVLGVVCVVLYLVSNDPWLTTVYATLADFIIGIPTLIKTVRSPKTEKSTAWIISLITWSLTLLISFNHDLVYAVFPIYLWLYCVLMVYLVYIRKVPQAQSNE